MCSQGFEQLLLAVSVRQPRRPHEATGRWVSAIACPSVSVSFRVGSREVATYTALLRACESAQPRGTCSTCDRPACEAVQLPAVGPSSVRSSEPLSVSHAARLTTHGSHATSGHFMRSRYRHWHSQHNEMEPRSDSGASLSATRGWILIPTSAQAFRLWRLRLNQAAETVYGVDCTEPDRPDVRTAGRSQQPLLGGGWGLVRRTPRRA